MSGFVGSLPLIVKQGREADPLKILQEFIIPARLLTPFYLLARRLLSICANSATCEQLFGAFGIMLMKLRNWLGTSTLSSLAKLKMHICSKHQKNSKTKT